MTWTRFDPDALTAPALDLRTTGGDPVNPAEFRGQYHLVLFFTHDAQCPACRALADRFDSMRHDLQTLDGRVLIVLPGSAGQVAEPCRGSVRRVVDPNGVSRERYGRLMPIPPFASDVMIFVLDQFGAPYAAWIGDEADRPGLDSQTLEWLEYVAIQCPE